MSLDDALFLVDRGGTNYSCQGQNLADRLQVGDKLLVQRNDQRFYTWFGKPSSADTPYLTRRCRFDSQCYDNGSGGSNHTDQPGEINLSYWWGCGGPSPIREWRNFRNNNAAGFVDLDGAAFPLQNNPDVLLGSVCRITSDAGWKSWHEITYTGGSDGLAFKPKYTNEAGDRERTDLQVEGVNNTYKPASGEILTFEFFDPEDIEVFFDIQDDDLLLAWDGDENKSVTGAQFKSLFSSDSLTVTVNDEKYIELDARTSIRWRAEAPGCTNLYEFFERSDGYVREEDHGAKDLHTSSMTPDPAGGWNHEWLQYRYLATFPNGDVIEDSARVRLLWYTTTNTLEDAQECHRQEYADYQYCKLLCETDYCLSICDSKYEEAVKECYESRGFDVPARISPPPRA
jgi:hypothetical protein